MREHFFISWLLAASITGIVLTAVILLVKLMCGRKLEARWHYYIWFLLLLKLLVPYTPESSFSIFNAVNYFTHQNNAIKQNQQAENTTFQNYVKLKQQADHLFRKDLSTDYSISVKRYDYFKILFIIWLSGAITSASCMFVLNLKTFFLLKHKYHIKNNDIIQLFEECKRKFGINAHIKLMYTANISPPALYGVLSPCLLIPESLTSKPDRKQLEHIIFHELAHFKRKDIFVNWLISFAQIIHWFNPFIAYALFKMRQDREIACDALALSRLEPDRQKDYGRTIIELLDSFSYPKHPSSIVTLSGDKKYLKKRITNIALYRKHSFANLVLGIIIFVFIGTLLLTNAKTGNAKAEISNLPAKNTNIEYENLSSYFKGFKASFVLFNKDKNCYTIYNKVKSQERISPCSTFKVFNSLIALENCNIKDKNSELKWNGINYPFSEWNRDQTLASAITYSVNWYFEQLDQQIGSKKMQSYLRKLNYGNNDISGGIRDFWLESSLKISPIEQVELLKKLYAYNLPFSKRNIDTVKKTIKLAKQDDAILSGKTGTGNVNGENINGWFIGYVEKAGNVYYFATNIQSEDGAYGKKAKEITLNILKTKHILP